MKTKTYSESLLHAELYAKSELERYREAKAQRLLEEAKRVHRQAVDLRDAVRLYRKVK